MMNGKRYSYTSIMQRITSMNGVLIVPLLFVVITIFSCSDNDIATALTDDDTSTGVSTGDIGRIAITVDKNADTRLEREGVETTFEEGDYVGCIILQGGSFYANSRWKVGTFDDEQRLTVDKFWIASSDSTTLNETAAVQYTDGDTYSSSNPIITYDSDGYTGTTSSTPVRLYFYYPYIDLKTEETNYIPSVTDDNETTTYLMGMATAESATTSGLSASTTNDNIGEYSWTQYPVFINTNQSAETSSNTTTDDDGNETTTTVTTAYKQDYSDFLWAAYTDGITNTDAGTLALTFKKKTATIEVSSGVELSDVKIVPVMNGMASGTTGNLIIGRYINLQTGGISSITSTSTNNETLSSNAALTSNTNTITPYSYESESVYMYRFLIPEQAANYSALQWTYTDDDNNSVTKELPLTQFADTLYAGSYYSANLYEQVSGFYYMYVSAYSSSSSATITQNGTESDGVYFINSTNKYQSSDTYNANITVTKEDNTTMSFNCQGAYELQNYSESNSYPCISFTLEAKATLTIYAYNTTDGNTTDNAATSTQSNPTIKYSTSSNTSSTTAISFSTMTGNTGVMKGSASLSKGSYILQKGNGANYIYLITAEY